MQLFNELYTLDQAKLRSSKMDGKYPMVNFSGLSDNALISFWHNKSRLAGELACGANVSQRISYICLCVSTCRSNSCCIPFYRR